MKLCKDCKWVREPGNYAKCAAPKNIDKRVELTGFRDDAEVRWRYCSTLREFNWIEALFFDGCGKSGKWYEPKESEA